MIPWKRFWCRSGEPIDLGVDGQGFLSDPEGELARFSKPNLFTLDQLFKEPCLILCGEPGIGKTTVLREKLKALKGSQREGRGMIAIDSREIPDVSFFARKTFDSADWRQWRSSNARLVLVVDGVDEGLVKIPDLVSYLTGQLREEPIERLQIILVCRSAEWPVSQGEQLISLWNRVEKSPIVESGSIKRPNPQNKQAEAKKSPLFELCPIRQCDAMLAAETWGFDKEAFIEAVYQQKVIGLATRPTTLFFLLAEFGEGGEFSGTHRELYEQGCERLSQEIDRGRAESQRALRKTTRVSTPQEIHSVAKRLAALFLVCGKTAIHIGPLEEAGAKNELHISEAADEECAEDLIFDTVASGLFTSSGPNRFAFAHQTFAECLAAQFLSRLPLIQIRRILCARDSGDEHVVPQLAEAAAWVAGRSDAFFDYLCRIEPEVLLRSDASKVQNQRKSVLVAAVLEKTNRAELFDEQSLRRFFYTLKHPGLAEQLRPYITGNTFHTVVRRMALDIAGACEVKELSDDLLQIIRDNTDDQQIRDQVAHALEDVFPHSRLSELIPLAMGQAGADPDDTIRACALRRLVPDLWTVSQALPAIRSPRNLHFFGSYRMLLKYHLPLHMRKADLSVVLPRLIRWTKCFDTLSTFENLAEAAFALALKNLDIPEIKRLAVRIWVVKQKHFHPLPQSQESPVLMLLNNNENLRREFVAAVIDDPKTPSDAFQFICGIPVSLFLQSDLEWSLNRIATAPVKRRVAWASAISNIRNPDATSKCWDLLLKRIEEIPELKAKFFWLRA